MVQLNLETRSTNGTLVHGSSIRERIQNIVMQSFVSVREWRGILRKLIALYMYIISPGAPDGGWLLTTKGKAGFSWKAEMDKMVEIFIPSAKFLLHILFSVDKQSKNDPPDQTKNDLSTELPL